MAEQNERPTPVAADVSQVASPGQDSAPNRVASPSGYVKRNELAHIKAQTVISFAAPWSEILDVWRQDAALRRARVAGITHASLLAEVRS